MSKFINLSNHPSNNWLASQLQEAQKYGEIIDIPFPHIDADISEHEVEKLAAEYCEKIVALNPAVVMVQGEFTFTYSVVRKLSAVGITCVASCSNRIAKETKKDDGTILRESVYEFKRFRPYEINNE